MKHFILALTMLLVSQSVLACDICGSSTGGHHFGLLPDYRLNVISLAGNYRHFYSTHPTLFADEVAVISNEYYTTATLEARIFVYKNWMLSGQLPYNQFVQTTENESITSQGLGDVSVSALHLWTFVDSSKFSHQLIVGGGIKLPTGKSNASSSEGVRYNDNLQPGTGSFDYSVNLNYLVRTEKLGLQVQSVFELKGTNDFGYKFGNRSESALKLLYWKQFGQNESNLMIPFFGASYAFGMLDYSNFNQEIKNEFSGGQTLSAQLGFNVFIQKLGFSASTGLPLWQDTAQGSVEQKSQLRFAVNYLF